jgi:hypothetical protein
LFSIRRDASKEALVFVQRFDRDTIAGLVHERLAAAIGREPVKADGKTVEVIRVTITDVSGRALEG